MMGLRPPAAVAAGELDGAEPRTHAAAYSAAVALGQVVAAVVTGREQSNTQGAPATRP